MIQECTKTDSHYPEIELILCCTRRRLTEDVEKRVRALCSMAIDWNYVYRLLCWHGLNGLFYGSLEKIPQASVPPEVRRRLKADYTGIASNNLKLTTEMLNLLKIFHENKVDVIVYKGPLQASQIYGNLAYRSISDLDFLVRKHEMQRIKEILLAHGYLLKRDVASHQYEDRVYGNAEYECDFVRKDGRISVEIHWQVLRKHSELGFDADYVWSRAVPATCSGIAYYDFPVDMKILLMSIHNEKHEWRYIKFICDVAWSLETCSAEDLEKIYHDSIRLNRLKSFLKTLHLCKALFAAPLPKVMEDRIDAMPEVKMETAITHHHVFKDGLCLPSFSEWFEIIRGKDYFRIKNTGFSSRVVYFWPYIKAILTPQYEDHKKFPTPLPRHLHILYVISRVLRLCKHWMMLRDKSPEAEIVVIARDEKEEVSAGDRAKR